MNSTSATLLQRLRGPEDKAAWSRFVQLYTPLLLLWAQRLGLQESDAADLVQDVFKILLHRLASFEYDADRKFRAWLRTVLKNRWRNSLRKLSAQLLGDNDVEVAAEPDDPVEEKEYREFLTRRAMELMQTDFEPVTWKAFWACTVDDRPAAEVAAELGISTGAVYVAKCRVQARLREELRGLLD